MGGKMPLVFGFCLVFQNRAQEGEFLAKTGLRAYGNKYLNGMEAAAKLGITLDTPFEGLPLHRIDPKLAALAPDLDKPYPTA